MANHPPVDVIIVGAGPAGATAAYHLGEAGQRVLLLEKETLPRYKPCGGGLSARMLAKWFPFSFDSVIETRPEAVTYAFGGHVVTIPVADRSLCMVQRAHFDAFLLRQARAEVCTGIAVRGVEETPESVKVKTANGSVFEASYLIGADGANSVVARAVGLRRRRAICPALEAEVHVAPEVLHRYARGPWFIGDLADQGYLWIFPKSNHLSVGIAALRPAAGELQAKLRTIMAGYEISLEGVALHGHPIPYYTRPEPLASVRTLLAGDAAGLVDPFSGEGIRLAVKSGYLAAQALLDGRPEQYSRTIVRQIGLSHMLGAGLGWLFYHSRLSGAALLAPNPEVTAGCLDMLADCAGYPKVVLRVAVSLPGFGLTRGARALWRLFGRPNRQAHGHQL